MTSYECYLAGNVAGAMQGFDLVGPVSKLRTFGVGLLYHMILGLICQWRPLWRQGMVPAWNGRAALGGQAKFNAAEHEAGNASFITGPVLCIWAIPSPRVLMRVILPRRSVAQSPGDYPCISVVH